MDEEEKEANRNLMKNLRQEQQDTKDPFLISEVAFVSLYTMPKVLFHELTSKLEPHMKFMTQSHNKERIQWRNECMVKHISEKRYLKNFGAWNGMQKTYLLNNMFILSRKKD